MAALASRDVLIVVPARGGSKGLPRKNARELRDIPLLGWTAEAVAASVLSNAACLLSTDDAEIADIGRRVGLEVPFMRPTDLAGDTASAESVAMHALDWIQSERSWQPQVVMWLQPTSPFRPPEVMNEALEHMSDARVPAVIGVKPIYRSLRTLYYSDNMLGLQPVDPHAAAETRRQEGRALYTPNGALYAIRTEVLRTERTFFPGASRAIVMDQIASLDIDDPTDWSIAEAVASSRLTWRDRGA